MMRLVLLLVCMALGVLFQSASASAQFSIEVHGGLSLGFRLASPYGPTAGGRTGYTLESGAYVGLAMDYNFVGGILARERTTPLWESLSVAGEVGKEWQLRKISVRPYISTGFVTIGRVDAISDSVGSMGASDDIDSFGDGLLIAPGVTVYSRLGQADFSYWAATFDFRINTIWLIDAHRMGMDSSDGISMLVGLRYTPAGIRDGRLARASSDPDGQTSSP